MDDIQTMVRTQLAFNDRVFYLAQGIDVDSLKSEIEAAVQSGPAFVEFVVVGNRTVSVLVSPHTHIVVSSEAVQFDPRDTGDDEIPYGGLFDF